MSDDFEKALDEAKKFGEHKGDIWPRSDHEAYHFRLGARWAREWLKSQYPFLYRYLNERQKLRAENEQRKELMEKEFQYRQQLTSENIQLRDENERLREAHDEEFDRRTRLSEKCGMQELAYNDLKAQADKLAEALEKMMSMDEYELLEESYKLCEQALTAYRNNDGE